MVKLQKKPKEISKESSSYSFLERCKLAKPIFSVTKVDRKHHRLALDKSPKLRLMKKSPTTKISVCTKFEPQNNSSFRQELSHDEDQSVFYEIRKIDSHRVRHVSNQECLELRVYWKGYADSTWESFDSLCQDAPSRVAKYVQRHILKPQVDTETSKLVQEATKNIKKAQAELLSTKAEKEALKQRVKQSILGEEIKRLTRFRENLRSEFMCSAVHNFQIPSFTPF